jgi:hypothetical protein
MANLQSAWDKVVSHYKDIGQSTNPDVGDTMVLSIIPHSSVMSKLSSQTRIHGVYLMTLYYEWKRVKQNWKQLWPNCPKIYFEENTKTRDNWNLNTELFHRQTNVSCHELPVILHMVNHLRIKTAILCKALMHTGWLGSPHFSQKKYNLYTT